MDMRKFLFIHKTEINSFLTLTTTLYTYSERPTLLVCINKAAFY